MFYCERYPDEAPPKFDVDEINKILNTKDRYKIVLMYIEVAKKLAPYEAYGFDITKNKVFANIMKNFGHKYHFSEIYNRVYQNTLQKLDALGYDTTGLIEPFPDDKKERYVAFVENGCVGDDKEFSPIIPGAKLPIVTNRLKIILDAHKTEYDKVMNEPMLASDNYGFSM